MLDVSFFLLGLNVNSIIASGDFTATADIAGGVYTLNGAPCAFGDIFDLASPDANYDPAFNIDSGGIKTGGFGAHPAYLPIKDPLLASMLADGFTVVLEFYYESNIDVQMQLHDPDFDLVPNTQVLYNLGNVQSSSSVQNVNYDGLSGRGPSPGEINKLVSTIADDRVSLSLNGGAVVTVSGTGLDPALSAAYFQLNDLNTAADQRLRSFAFYEVVADADLPALSDLGYPILTVAPAISGTSQVGQTITCSTGTWTHAGAFTYQWFSETTLIVGATSNSYLIAPEDEGFTPSCVVRSTNGSGFAEARKFGDVVVGA